MRQTLMIEQVRVAAGRVRLAINPEVVVAIA